MAADARLICRSSELQDGGRGVRFSIERRGAAEPAFAVRFDGRVRAYVNRCGHVPVELDWQYNEFFDDSKLYLICATHGALYSPADGRCLGGRCNGRGLTPVAVEERDGAVYLTPSEQEP
ncbi:MAG: Rieske [2Fe-2S] domain protein [Candidatus Accumulibacter sp. BA-94]|nr:MAG: Rieske [2Fe-2S] domain protein [Candidatus Accumulibacter sp. BA-94]MBL8391399.1 Rieske 2Fe-2S domain-containing protein [Accumulibacter sp.]